MTVEEKTRTTVFTSRGAGCEYINAQNETIFELDEVNGRKLTSS
jgi:hypothetical protein